MIDMRRVILSLLEELECTFTMRPVHTYPTLTRVCVNSETLLCLFLPEGNSLTILNINDHKFSILEVEAFCPNFPGGIPPRKSYEFDLTSPDDFEKLRQYLEEKCHNRRVIVEFEESLDLDYVIA